MRIKWRELLTRVIGSQKREPARLARSIGVIISGAVFVLTNWGFDVSSTTQDRVNVTLPVVCIALVSVMEFLRPYVTPVAKAEAAIDIATQLPPGSTPPKLEDITP